MNKIAKAINNVMKEVKFVVKDGKLKAGNRTIKTVTHDGVVALVREEMVKQELTIFPTNVDIFHSEIFSSKSGAQGHKMEGVISFTVLHGSGESVIIQVPAVGMSFDDKYTGKMISYAKKYALLQLFLLETGEEDPDEGNANKFQREPAKKPAAKKPAAKKPAAKAKSPVTGGKCEHCGVAADTVPSAHHPSCPDYAAA